MAIDDVFTAMTLFGLGGLLFIASLFILGSISMQLFLADWIQGLHGQERKN